MRSFTWNESGVQPGHEVFAPGDPADLSLG